MPYISSAPIASMGTSLQGTSTSLQPFATDAYSASLVPAHTATRTRAPTVCNCCLCPISSIVASAIAVLAYAIGVALVVMAESCVFSVDVTETFVFLLLAIVSVVCLTGLNLLYARYHFNLMSLIVQYMVAGSAWLILYDLVHTGLYGLCKEGTSALKAQYWADICIWAAMLFGFTFQTLAHFLYI